MEKFSVTRTDKGAVTLLSLNGFLDAHTAPAFENALKTLMNEKRYAIVVDMSELEYISSAGMGIFMGFIEEVRENQGDIKFCCVNPRVYKVFDLLGFPNIFEFYATREEAIGQFKNIRDHS